MPESSRASKQSDWTSQRSSSTDIRRRDSESVLAEKPGSSPVKPAAHPLATKPARKETIPHCFQSLNSCETATKNCTGHGSCINRYVNDTSTKLVCFACHCQPEKLTLESGGKKGERTIYWAGQTCSKEDISAPFWILASLTIALIGAVTFAIGLLFSVGQEQLPGVIGAGVGKSK
jgi:hypothetical protein